MSSAAYATFGCWNSLAIVVGSRLLFSYAQQPAPSVCCCPYSGFYLAPPVLPSQVHSSWPPSTSSSTPKVLMRQYGRWRRRLWLTCPHHRGNASKAECFFLSLILSAPPWGYYITTLRECFDFVYPDPVFVYRKGAPTIYKALQGRAGKIPQ